MDTAYRFGIEEEIFLADATTRDTPERSLEAFHRDAATVLPTVERELLSAQLEIASPPSTSFDEARATLARYRSDLAATGRAHGLLLFASGTHPMARWSGQSHTRKARYDALLDELQIIGRRDVVCGMHVHVEVPRPDDRVDLMNRLVTTLPVLLALSASSPFWQGAMTGLAAYRPSVWGEMPRTGLPPVFEDQAAYDRYVRIMVAGASIRDARSLWWMLRPCSHAPTLELRVSDSCTRLDDTLAVAALYRCLVRRAVRIPAWNRNLAGVSRALVAENMWRAQRDGVHARLIDETEVDVPFAANLDAMVADIAEDAEALGCVSEIERARAIVREGTSSDRQRALFEGASSADPMHAVVDWLAAATASA